MTELNSNINQLKTTTQKPMESESGGEWRGADDDDDDDLLQAQL